MKVLRMTKGYQADDCAVSGKKQERVYCFFFIRWNE